MINSDNFQILVKFTSTVIFITVLYLIHKYVTSIHSFTDNEYSYFIGIAVLASCGGHSIRYKESIYNYTDGIGVIIFAISIIWGFFAYKWYIPMYGFWIVGPLLEVISSYVSVISSLISGHKINGFRPIFIFIGSYLAIYSLMTL